MASIDLIRSCIDSIRQLIGAFPVLLELGVHAVCSLENASPLDGVREAMEAVAEYGRPDVELIIGGTTLLTPSDTFDLLLGSSSYI